MVIVFLQRFYLIYELLGTSLLNKDSPFFIGGILTFVFGPKWSLSTVVKIRDPV